jgi:anti-sigma regulatory factor (Ser/Thr protein kinase)
MVPEQTRLPLVVRSDFAAVATAASAARSFVRHSLRDWGQSQLTEDAEVIASELVTNAVKATHTPAGDHTDLCDLPLVGVELQMDEGAFRIAVRDSSHEQPRRQTRRTVGDDAENGRGLFLVDALSTRWDVFFVAGGKVTWAELALDIQRNWVT